MDIVIIAGGKGIRLGTLTLDVPKPMVLLEGKPVLEYQIELAKQYNLKEIIILSGYMSDKIEEYFFDGKWLGVNIKHINEQFPLGTAGCLKQIEEFVSDDFIVFNADIVMDFDILKMIDFHYGKDSAATLFLHPNDHPYDSDLIEIDDNGYVLSIYPNPHSNDRWYKNLVIAGVYIFKKSVLQHIKKNIKADVGKDLLPTLLHSDEMISGYISSEYVKDMGTHERYEKVKKDFLSGKIKKSNLKYKRPAIFIDRDGVINKEINLLCKADDFELLPGVAGAIKKINDSGYLAVVVTNQPVIARNLTDFNVLRQIHNKMEWLLGKQGCYLDAIYFCPHHPDSGYPEERKEFKIDCDCRKPKPGMILRAAEELNIDLEKSFIIGDRESDVVAGKNAGITTVLVKINGEYWENQDSCADMRFNALEEAINAIL